MTMPPEKLSSHKNKLAVAQLKYNKLRSSAPSAEIAVVEGDEDSIFYSAILLRENLQLPSIFFVANGKDNVLGLRDWLSKAKDVSRTGSAIFFVDKDFDGLKGFPSGDDLYITPTYSIENMLVSRAAISNLLRAEFKLGDEELMHDVEKNLLKFDAILQQYEIELKEANELIHCVRQEALAKNPLTKGSMDDNCEKYLSIDPKTLRVTKIASGDELRTLVRVTENFDNTLLAKHASTFTTLRPLSDWRGKFVFYLFRRFLAILVEDRNTKVSNHFARGGGKVSMDVRQDSIVRILASMCEIPACLKAFLHEWSRRRSAI